MWMEDFSKVINDFERSRQDIKNYRDELIRLRNWNFNNDLRIVFLSQLDNILVPHNLNVKYIIEKLSDLNWTKLQLQILDNSGASDVLNNYIIYNKLSLIYILSSIVERYLRVIWNTIKHLQYCNDNFYVIRKNVFNFLNFGLDGNEWKALSVLFNIRNTIHNNGIHLAKGKELKNIIINYHNRVVIFSDNNIQGNSTYENFNLILNDFLSLSKMINSHEVILKFSCIEENLEFKF